VLYSVFYAIYIARLEPYKRHELAKKTENLALLYDPPFDGSSAPLEPQIRKLLPHARFLNHEIGKGQHPRLSRETVAREVNRARVGLCLSGEEGPMRAAMEYLLCGLPIVTTRSAGGRDRYCHAPFALVVRDDPDQVRAAVAELIARNLNKLEVREYIGRIVAFERRNVLSAINAIACEHFGISEMFTTPEPFIRAQPFTDPTSEWGRERLERAAKTLGIALPAVATSGMGPSAR
jgi:glycosyltransferase involved in cell wall biosynthesis